jgi:broad specificity phosphatase PhoE
MLNMLDSGIYHGMSTEEIEKKHPEEFEKFSEDPFNYRFPGGESYHDVSIRLAAFVKEVERHHSPIVIISHLSTLRVLYGYFVGCPADQLPFLELPQHCVIKLTPSNYGWIEERAFVKGNTFEVVSTNAKHGTNFYTKNKNEK